MSGFDSGDEVSKREAMSEDAVCVPAEFQESVLDDALELDAPESDDDETAETSTNTVIYVPSGSNLSEGPDVSEVSKPTAMNGTTDPEQTTAIASHERSAQNHHRRSNANKKPSISGPNVDSKESVSSRRRQWGSHSGDRTSSTVPSISSDTLEKLVPTLTSGSEQKPKTHTSSSISETHATTSDANLAENKDSDLGQDHEPDEMTTLTMVTESGTAVTPGTADVDSSSVSRGGSSAPTAIQKRSSSKNTDATNVTGHSKPASVKRKGPKETKAVGYLIEAPERIESCTPAKHRPTDIVHIRSLVRPFTADQLRQMISERFGPVLDLWLDRIKSSSLVRLESVEIATRCREGLDGCRWPSMNPHALHCDFGNDELFAWMKEHGNSGENVPPKHLVTGEKPSKIDETVGSTSVTNGRKKSDADAKGHQDMKPVDSRQGKTERSKGSSKPTPKDTVGKEASESKRRCEEPAKLLDDLFRKTTCTPCIYWLPLTDEQAKKQAVERAKLLQTNPPAATRPMGRPFVHGPTGPKQRATRSPFTSPVSTEQLVATHTGNRSSSGLRSNGSRTRSNHEVELKDKRKTSVRVEPSPLSVSHARRRSRSPNTKHKRSQSSVSPPRVAPQERIGSKTHDRRPTPTTNRSGRPVAKRRDPTPPSPPRPRVVRRSTSSRSRSRSSLSSPSSRSSSSRSHSRNRGNIRRGKAPYRGSGRPRSRSFGRRSSPTRARR